MHAPIKEIDALFATLPVPKKGTSSPPFEKQKMLLLMLS
ncbi:MAG: hypothetical protein ACI9FN_001812 [Saprospiraceae bacterium]|jgi:hypothetical protein